MSNVPSRYNLPADAVSAAQVEAQTALLKKVLDAGSAPETRDYA